LEILVAEKNIGNSTYDGIELGAERVTKEIEDHIAKLKEDGKRVEKLSITGYSLGGVVARYVIGLLYTRGVFDTVQPMVSFGMAWIGYTDTHAGRTSQHSQHHIWGRGRPSWDGTMISSTIWEGRRFQPPGHSYF